MIHRAVVVACACAVLSACQSAPSAPGPEPRVRAALQAWADAFNAGDADNAAALYASDATLWGTVSPEPIVTPEGIRQYFARGFSATPKPTVALSGEPVVRVAGDMATGTGSYTFTLAVQGQVRTLPARFSFAYRRAGDAWLIASHHSSLMPAAPSPAPASAAAR